MVASYRLPRSPIHESLTRDSQAALRMSTVPGDAASYGVVMREWASRSAFASSSHQASFVLAESNATACDCRRQS
jgi:hypothetical protein